jgi:hypothetical protein
MRSPTLLELLKEEEESGEGGQEGGGEEEEEVDSPPPPSLSSSPVSRRSMNASFNKQGMTPLKKVFEKAQGMDL